MTPLPLDPTNRAAWLSRFRQGFAGRPGTSPGQAFQPGAITGGLKGPTIVASTQSDLVDALAMPGPAWIVALPSAGGRLAERLDFTRDNKTLIAPHGIEIERRGLRLVEVMNVAIHGVTVRNVVGDAFEFVSSRVAAFSDCHAEDWTDGAWDSVEGATDITLIGCIARGGGKAKKGMLVGKSPAPFTRDYRGTNKHHLGLMDDRFARLSLINCRFEGVHVRTPLVRHGLVTLEQHTVVGGGKGPLVEARDGGRVAWLSGRVEQLEGRPQLAATWLGPDAGRGGHLYVAPGVRLGGARVETNVDRAGAEVLAANYLAPDWSEVVEADEPKDAQR